MAISASVLDAMVAAGATPEVIVAAVKADAATAEMRAAEKRAKDAERKRRSRQPAVDVRNVTRTDADSAGQARTDRDIPDAVSPRSPPKDNTQTPHPTPSGDEGGMQAHGPQRMPREFRLSESDRGFARDLGWSESEIDDGEAELVDYWSNPKLPASKALKLDWSAVWRNRVRDLGKRRGNGRNVTTFAPKANGSPNDATSVHLAGRRLLERAREAERLQSELRDRGSDPHVRLLEAGGRG